MKLWQWNTFFIVWTCFKWFWLWIAFKCWSCIWRKRFWYPGVLHCVRKFPYFSGILNICLENYNIPYNNSLRYLSESYNSYECKLLVILYLWHSSRGGEITLSPTSEVRKRPGLEKIQDNNNKKKSGAVPPWMILELCTSDLWEKYHFLGVGRKKSNATFIGAVTGFWIVPQEAAFLYEILLLEGYNIVTLRYFHLWLPQTVFITGFRSNAWTSGLVAVLTWITVLNQSKHGLVCIHWKVPFSKAQVNKVSLRSIGIHP